MLPSHVDVDDFASNKVDEQLLVRFFIKERPDNNATREQGRPIYREVEYVEIRVPGNRDPQACRPATHADKQRFPRHYEAFKQRVEPPVTGTPLSEWPQISRSQAEELAFLNVKTVEQLAELGDNYAGRLHGGHTLKRRAGEWLQQADQTKLIAEKEALEKRLADMEKKLAEVMSAKAEMPAPSALDEAGDGDETPAPKRTTRRRGKRASE